ncbi:MAG TPA: PilZ domain-containing protein [Polyangia bacterium]|jgi:ABC-type transporter Mla MlaB component
MLSVLAYDHPGLIAALQGGCFRRVGLRVTALPWFEDLVEETVLARPDVVVLPTGLVSGERLRAILGGLRAQAPGTCLLLAELPDRGAAPPAPGHDLCDGVIAAADPEADLRRALAPLLHAAPRLGRRFPAGVPVLVCPDSEHPVEAVAADVSRAGAGLRLARAPAAEGPWRLRFYRPDGRTAGLRGTPRWQRRAPDGEVQLGVAFVDPLPDEVARLLDLAFWRCTTEDGEEIIHLQGELSEATDCRWLLPRLVGAPRFDLAGISRVSSAGVVHWLQLLRALPPEVRLRLRRVPVPFAFHASQLPALLQRCVVESQYLPHACDRCGREVVQLVRPDGTGMDARCAGCGGALRPAARPLVTCADP